MSALVLCPLCLVALSPDIPHEHHLPRVEDADLSAGKFVETLADGYRKMSELFAKQEGGGDE